MLVVTRFLTCLPLHATGRGARCEVRQDLVPRTLLPQARDIRVAATLEMMRARCRLRSCIFARAGVWGEVRTIRSEQASVWNSQGGKLETSLGVRTKTSLSWRSSNQ